MSRPLVKDVIVFKENHKLIRYFLLLGLVGGLQANGFASTKGDNRVEEVKLEFQKIVDEFAEKCKMHEKKQIPETTLDRFCSDSPFNNISVRYCIYQNLLIPDNDESIKLRFPKQSDADGIVYEITVSTKCSDIEI
jgi:hypothetical protein